MGLGSWFNRRDRDDEVTVPAAPTEQDVRAALNRVNTMLTEHNAPPVVRARVMRVLRAVNQTLPRLGQLGLGSQEGYSVVATATDYLPEALESYFRLPRDWADTRPIDGAKTALLVLIEQLELLGATAEQILDAANRADAQALVAHGRFLEAKFGHAGSGGPDLSLGAP